MTNNGIETLTKSSQNYLVKNTDVLYIKPAPGKPNNVILKCKNGQEYTRYATLKHYDESNNCFVQINKSCVVNMENISSVHKNLKSVTFAGVPVIKEDENGEFKVVIEDKKFTVSCAYKENLEHLLSEYS